MERMNRTDLAKEALARCPDIPGVVKRERTDENGVTVTRITVESPEAADKLGKPEGTYLTVELPESPNNQNEAAGLAVAEGLSSLLKGIDGHVLVIGLGNRRITPDALGPSTVEKLFVTRHIRAFAPELAPSGMRTVSALSPGVLGVTGLETAEVVKGLIASVGPAAVLCIDALASERVERMADVIQMNDVGLLPGAGVGNRQRGLNRETLGLPVFALGVPTVVYASTIAHKAVELLTEKTGVGGDGASLADMAAALTNERLADMVVTPKDVDKLVEDASRRLADGINRALLAGCYEEICALLTQ